MYLNNRSKLSLLLLIICFFFQITARSQGCVDTINSKQFNVDNFGGSNWGGSYQDQYDNLYLMGTIRPANPVPTIKSTLIKFNYQKKVIWSKTYNASAADAFSVFRRFSGTDNEQNLYFSTGNPNTGQFINFLKLDSNGNILQNKNVRVLNSIFGYFNNAIKVGKIFSTLINFYNNNTGKDVHVVATNQDLSTIRWSKQYKPSLTNYLNATTNNGIEIDDTTTVMCMLLSYRNPLNSADTVHTFHLLKINSLTGDIILQKAYSAFDQQNTAKTVNAYPSVRNVNYNNKEIIFQHNRSTAAGLVYSFFKADSNLNIIDSASYLPNMVFNIADFSNINSNEIVFNGTLTQNGLTKLATFTWDTNLQIASQKTYYSSQFVGSNYANLTYKNSNNTVSYFVPSSNFFNPVSFPVYLFDNIKNPNFENDCTDKDAAIFQPVAPHTYITHTSGFTGQPGFNFEVKDNFITYTAQNNNFSEEKYCDLISTCTFLKIQGNTSFCLNKSNIDSFKVVRNSGCLRKTIWSVDISQMQILQSNDTSVRVKFLRPFKGYIKAAYENCVVTDSMYIEVDTVYTMKTGVYLGPDTIQCIGQGITLNAGTGFKKYEWQDGSILNTYTTSDTGLFHVKVLDSCNTVFKDSVRIFQNPKKLNIGYGNPLCEYDTARITLPVNFTNYSWLPFTSSFMTGNTLLFYPTGTTLYTITAQSHNNCFVDDTLLIKKKDCYGSLYFPTAFSPNNDGLNDVYRGTAIGILQSFSFTIYNRYGSAVFHTNDINNGWNGKYKDQILAGSFTWVCTYLFRSRKQETESGSFVLLR